MSPNGTGKDRQFERWKPAGTSALFSLSLARIMHKFSTAAPKSSVMSNPFQIEWLTKEELFTLAEHASTEESLDKIVQWATQTRIDECLLELLMDGEISAQWLSKQSQEF